jgi:hypothetical protein
MNLSLPQYASLSTVGGFTYVSGGVRGLIIYRKDSNIYLAFERNCSFQPTDACATVEALQLYMQDACCGSTFNYSGTPTGGLAWRPLQQYATSLSGTILTITDTIVN